MVRLADTTATTEATEMTEATETAKAELDRARAEVGVPPASRDTGYLIGDGKALRIQCVKADKGGSEAYTQPWADFDLEAVGRVVEPGGIVRAYVALLHTGHGAFELVIDPRDLADERKLRPLLASYDATYESDPPNVAGRMAPGLRLLRYLKSQNAPDARVVPHLGWDEGSQSFVTFSGVIRADGHHDSTEPGVGVVADPSLRAFNAQFEYGFDADMDTARAIVREVLTWHDEQTMAVFGAWWTATLLKPQTRRRTSLFPFMVLEASSESGKSTGAWGDLLQLSGYASKGEVSTRATFRDKVSVNRSGIVWNDDADDLGALEEILRAATADAAMTKKGADNTTTSRFALVAPILLSGEGFDIASQKALSDRAVLLTPPSPKDRVSLRDPSRPQWLDMQDLRAEHGNLTRYAGWVVQFALQHADQYLDRLAEAQKRYASAGRMGDKLATLTAGAWLLDEMAGNGTWAQDLTGAWCDRQSGAYLEGADSLITKVIPWALREFGVVERKHGERTRCIRSFGSETYPPVLVTDPGTLAASVWVNTGQLAHLWEKHRGGAKERTETKEALERQIAKVATPKAETFTVSESEGNKTRKNYRQLLPAYGQHLLREVEG